MKRKASLLFNAFIGYSEKNYGLKFDRHIFRAVMEGLRIRAHFLGNPRVQRTLKGFFKKKIGNETNSF